MKIIKILSSVFLEEGENIFAAFLLGWQNLGRKKSFSPKEVLNRRNDSRLKRAVDRMLGSVIHS